jgi:phenylpyruvate tautomerase PptA (4-oxalocrotonate tautomerase family)
MPLITITLAEGKYSASEKQTISDGVHRAIVAAGFPETDKFQRILELPSAHFIYNATHPNLTEPRSDKFIAVEILLSVGRSVEFKKTILTTLIENLQHDVAVAPNDVLVVFIETARENWAFASGVQYYVEQAK